MAQALQGFLGSGESLGRLREHAERLRRLQQTLEQLLPPGLVQQCAIGNLKKDSLILLARNGATAARLKQLLPSLTAQFVEQGAPITRIQVKVSLAPQQAARPAPPARRIGTAGRSSLIALAETLPPDSPLRQSLEKLLANCRGD